MRRCTMVSFQILSLPKNELKPIDFRHYYIDRTLFEIAKIARGREMAMLNHRGAIRHIKAHALFYIKENFKAFDFYDNPRNLYYSLAHLEGMPMFSFAPPVRKQQQLVFNQNFRNYFKGLDFGMDFDERCQHCKDNASCLKYDKLTNKSICSKCDQYESNFGTLYQEVVRTKELFDTWSIPYQLKLSGSGFHINIEYEYFSKCKDVIIRLKRLGSLAEEDEIALSKWVLTELAEINYLTSLDTSVSDIRRIWKMPYSIDIKSGNVALPLTDEQFEDFNFDMVKPENVIDTIRGRGLLERPGSADNVLDFIENFLLG